MTTRPMPKIFRILDIKRDEVKLLLTAFLFMFVLFCSYSLLRPLRDSMGIAGGIKDLKWLFSATFVATLLGSLLSMWASSILKRRNFISAVFIFFIVNLLVFYGCFRYLPHDNEAFVWVARGFFVWTSLFVMFVISVAWSLISDVFNREQSNRLFGIIAAGVSLGSIVGSSVVSLLAAKIGIDSLVLCSVFLLIAASFLKNALLMQIKHSPTFSERFDNPVGAKNPFVGFKILFSSRYLLLFGVFIVLLSSAATFLYMEQVRLVALLFKSREEHLSAFATINLVVQVMSLLGQLLITGFVSKKLGMRFLLCFVPLSVGIGFVVLCLSHPAFVPFIIVFVLRSVGEYTLIRPAREMLFVPLDGDSKYKVKNFLDTVVYRGGDALSAQIESWLRQESVQVALLSGAACCLAWGVCGWVLGSRYQKKEFS